MYNYCNGKCDTCKDFFDKTCPFTQEDIKKAHKKQLQAKEKARKAEEEKIAEAQDIKRTKCSRQNGCEGCYADEHCICPYV